MQDLVLTNISFHLISLFSWTWDRICFGTAFKETVSASVFGQGWQGGARETDRKKDREFGTEYECV